MNLQAFYLNAVQSKKAVLALGAAGVALIGVVDYATGPDVGATIMYLIPLMFATWYAGWYAGVAISVTAGVVWFFAMYLWRAGEGSYAWLYWNALMRIGIFLVIARLLHNFKTLKEGLEQEVEKRTEALRRELARRSELERSLVESERTYKGLVENAMVGVFKSNVWGEILYVNPAIVQMFEYDSAEEMMSRNALLHYKNVTDRERFIEELTRSGKVANFELQLLTKYQRTKVVQVSATLEGNIISGMVRDITTLKALEKRLTEVDRLESLGTLAGGIAHDFNNILGIILGHAALVGRFSDRPERVRRGVQAIISASQRGSGLVRQLLTFARKADVVLDTVHINTVVHDVAHLLSETFPKNIAITTHLATGLPLLTADINQLHQVLINLCVNARDAMSSGGTLTLRTQLMSGDAVRTRFPTAQAEHYVVVEVSDTGTGMSEEVRRRVFEPFFTTKERSKGTGLGLAVVYGIIESHAGFVDVASVPGEGSTFTVFLPAKGPADEGVEEKVALSEVLPGGDETILIIEDEEQLRELAEAILTAHGYTVLTAADGEEGVALYSQRQHEIDLVFSDLGLPRLSGYDVFRRLLQINPFVRFVMTSGYMDPEQKAEILALGARSVLQKPYTPGDLLTQIRAALDS